MYSFAFPSLALILPTLLGLVMNVAMLTVAVRYRPRRAAEAIADDDELAAEFAQLLADEHARRISEIGLDRAEATLADAA